MTVLSTLALEERPLNVSIPSSFFYRSALHSQKSDILLIIQVKHLISTGNELELEIGENGVRLSLMVLLLVNQNSHIYENVGLHSWILTLNWEMRCLICFS